MKNVTIPKTIIKNLKPFGPRYIKVMRPILGNPKTGKAAIEPAWQLHPYEADDLELQKWLKNGGNYGVVCGEGVIEIDIDDSSLRDFLVEKNSSFANTFTVKSGSGEGWHFYFRSNIEDNATILGSPDENGKRENLGNVQAHHKYVVGPCCNHFTGGIYEIVNDKPLAWINRQTLEDLLGDKLVWSKSQRKLIEKEATEELKQAGFNFPITELVDLNELKQISKDEWQGAHPVHGSTTGINFCINTRKNVWHCFRCSSGGGPLSLLALREGIIQCHEMHKGALKGKLFKRALKIAKERGYNLGDIAEGTLKPSIGKYFRGQPPRFIPPLLAEDLLKQFHYVTRKSDGTIFVYHPDEGIYTVDGEVHIRKQVQKILQNATRVNRQREVINYIQNATFHDIKEAPPHLIALKNGIFNLETRELMPLTPDIFILNALPVYYDAHADCPKIKKFLGEIVAKDDIDILQEMVGYCLMRDHRFHKALMLVGEGANGKSTFLELLRALLGKENTATIPLQTLTYNRFALGSLYGKMANIYPDLPDKGLQETGTFKMLTGGDTISAEHKFKDRFQFKSYAKMIFSANKLPKSPDDTTAFFRRWLIINFPNQFLRDDPKTDPDILEKLATKDELSGFFNFAIEGLKQLLKNKGFSHSKTITATREQYIRASDSVKAFVIERVVEDPGNTVSKEDVYAAYIEYCKRNKLPTVAKHTFAMSMPQHIRTKSARLKIGGKRTWCWRDIRVSDVSESKISKFVEVLDE